MTNSNLLLQNMIMSGTIGFIQYWVLERFKLFYFYEQNDKLQRTALVSILSTFYFMCLSLIMTVTSRKLNFEFYYFVTFFVSAGITFFIFKIINKIMGYLNKRTLDQGRSIYSYEPLLDKLIDMDLINSSNYLVISDFNDKIVEQGYLREVVTTVGKMEFWLHPGDWDEEGDDFNYFRNKINDDWLIYVSAKDRLRIYILKDPDDKTK